MYNDNIHIYAFIKKHTPLDAGLGSKNIQKKI